MLLRFSRIFLPQETEEFISGTKECGHSLFFKSNFHQCSILKKVPVVKGHGYALRLAKLVKKVALSYPYNLYDTREKGEFEAQRVPD